MFPLEGVLPPGEKDFSMAQDHTEKTQQSRTSYSKASRRSHPCC